MDVVLPVLLTVAAFAARYPDARGAAAPRRSMPHPPSRIATTPSPKVASFETFSSLAGSALSPFRLA